jgi:hypothetical protein
MAGGTCCLSATSRGCATRGPRARASSDAGGRGRMWRSSRFCPRRVPRSRASFLARSPPAFASSCRRRRFAWPPRSVRRGGGEPRPVSARPGARTENRSGRPKGRPLRSISKSKALAATYRLEAVQAVHRTGACRHERHLRRLAAVRADHVVHDPNPPVPVGRPPGGPAFGAAPGFVLESPRLVELLLAGREDELPATVATRQRPIYESYGHRTGLPLYSR